VSGSVWMKFGRRMINHVEKKTANINVKTPFKDDIRQLADLKQQISQKMILLRSTLTLWRCAAM